MHSLNRIKQVVFSWFSPSAKATQAQAILATLQKGPATNRELGRIAARFGARILELRERGHDIYICRDGRTVYYTLVNR